MKKLLGIMASVLTVIALGVASSASTFLWHQPKEPKALKK